MPIPRPNNYVRGYGFSGIPEFSRKSKIPQRTLYNWWKNKPNLFKYLVKGVYFDKKSASDKSKH